MRYVGNKTPNQNNYKTVKNFNNVHNNNYDIFYSTTRSNK